MLIYTEMDSGRIFIMGGTGYMGQPLIRELVNRGHNVTAVVREGSEKKLPPNCAAVIGNVLDSESYARHVPGHSTFVQLVGVAHPGPAKAQQFVEIDERSAMEAIRVSRSAGIGHFVYISVAHPAPAMHAYVAVRTRCELAIRESGLNATILRPWYVLGPGHQWPRLLIPFYWLAERIPSKRESALRLGLVTIDQMIASLVRAVEHPVQGIEIVDVPGIRLAQ
jgi:uncharacterized protein YbjT (DUF2867 family)